jgi:hypothetical protein
MTPMIMKLPLSLTMLAATVADVLIGFSESAENVAALVGVQKTGISYLPYHDG